MKTPECLHIPTLYEGEPAQISWGVDEPNLKYVIERNFNESFTQASTGYTWANIDNTNETWNEYDRDTLNWNQIENRAGRGRTWERLDYEGLSWLLIDNKSETWQQLENQEISFEIFRGDGCERPGVEQGRTWLEMDKLEESWYSLESPGYTWAEYEKLTLPGLSWESIYSRWLSFDEWEQKGLTFGELDTLQIIEEHRGMTDTVPIGASTAIYRIKASNSAGTESDYLTTSQMPVIPIFYRSSMVEYPVTAGKRYRILVGAQDVWDLNRVRMKLRYNQYMLELINFSAYGTKKISAPGNYPDVQLKVYFVTPGEIQFQSTKPLIQNECYSGPITLVDFIAKKTGTATISLS